jgi:site-specific DNA-methyltransferase (adenine-specific)
MSKLELNQLYHMDCMAGMSRFPDGYFAIAVVDPPYGSASGEAWSDDKRGRFGGQFDRYRAHAGGGKNGSFSKYGDRREIEWDVAPGQEYFDELRRVSKNQVVWGGNYFSGKLPPSRNFLIWDKCQPSTVSFAMAEYAWVSIVGNSKLYRCPPWGEAGNVHGEARIHPTQKPVALYSWILSLYAKPGDIVLDTHVGSGSSLIACHNADLDFIGFEIDEHYYNLAKERLDRHMAQYRLQDYAEKRAEQLKLALI